MRYHNKHFIYLPLGHISYKNSLEPHHLHVPQAHMLVADSNPLSVSLLLSPVFGRFRIKLTRKWWLGGNPAEANPDQSLPGSQVQVYSEMDDSEWTSEWWPGKRWFGQAGFGLLGTRCSLDSKFPEDSRSCAKMPDARWCLQAQKWKSVMPKKE